MTSHTVWFNRTVEQLTRTPEHPIQHRRGEAAGVRVLLPQLNVSTPKRSTSSACETLASTRLEQRAPPWRWPDLAGARSGLTEFARRLLTRARRSGAVEAEPRGRSGGGTGRGLSGDVRGEGPAGTGVPGAVAALPGARAGGVRA